MWNGWFHQNTQLDMVRMDVGNPLNMFDHFIFPLGIPQIVYIYICESRGSLCLYMVYYNIYMYICIYIYINSFRYVCNYACVCIYIYMYICVCACVHIHIRIYIYIYILLYYWSLYPTFAPQNPQCFWERMHTTHSLQLQQPTLRAARSERNDGENRGPKNKPWLFQY